MRVLYRELWGPMEIEQYSAEGSWRGLQHFNLSRGTYRLKLHFKLFQENYCVAKLSIKFTESSTKVRAYRWRWRQKSFSDLNVAIPVPTKPSVNCYINVNCIWQTGDEYGSSSVSHRRTMDLQSKNHFKENCKRAPIPLSFWITSLSFSSKLHI